MRRQATIGEAEYEFFSDDLLEYAIDDIHAGLNAIGAVARREGETAFPEIGFIVSEVRSYQVKRLRYKRDTERIKADEEYKAKAIRELREDQMNPAEWQRQIDAVAERLQMDRKPKEIDTAPRMMTCPHCSHDLPVAGNIRFWTTDELRKYADELDMARAQKLTETVVSK